MTKNSNFPSYALTFDFFNHKSIGVPIGHRQHVWSIINGYPKERELLSGNSKNNFNLNLTLTFNLLTQNSIEVFPHVWSIIIVCQKEIQLSSANSKQFWAPIWPRPLDPKINRGHPWVLVKACARYNYIICINCIIIVCSKIMELSCRNTFSKDRWTNR